MSTPEALVQRWNARLHFGDFAGAFSKILYLVSRLIGVGLVVTGYVLWWLKPSRRTAAAKRRASAQDSRRASTSGAPKGPNHPDPTPATRGGSGAGHPLRN